MSTDLPTRARTAIRIVDYYIREKKISDYWKADLISDALHDLYVSDIMPTYRWIKQKLYNYNKKYNRENEYADPNIFHWSSFLSRNDNPEKIYLRKERRIEASNMIVQTKNKTFVAECRLKYFGYDVPTTRRFINHMYRVRKRNGIAVDALRDADTVHRAIEAYRQNNPTALWHDIYMLIPNNSISYHALTYRHSKWLRKQNNGV